MCKAKKYQCVFCLRTRATLSHRVTACYPSHSHKAPTTLRLCLPMIYFKRITGKNLDAAWMMATPSFWNSKSVRLMIYQNGWSFFCSSSSSQYLMTKEHGDLHLKCNKELLPIVSNCHSQPLTLLRLFSQGSLRWATLKMCPKLRDHQTTTVFFISIMQKNPDQLSAMSVSKGFMLFKKNT